MRTIKFRVWNNKTKSWIHGPHEKPYLDGVNLMGENILFGNFLDGVSIEDFDEIEVAQFTGLKDKNGREIFEGDLVQFECEPGEPITSKVVFDKGYFGLYRGEEMNPALLYPYMDAVVVGNVFENPELCAK